MQFMQSLFKNRDASMIQLMNGVLLALVTILFFVDRGSAVQMAALVGTTMLALTLLPARIMGLSITKPVEGDLLRIASNGKWLGIWTGGWFLVYTIFTVLTYFPDFHASQLFTREMVLLTISLMIFVLLLALSNKWSYAHVKWWKHINMIIWLTVPYLFTHLWLAGSIFSGASVFWVPLALLVVMALAGVSGVLRVKRDYFAVHRVLILLFGVAVSVLVVLLYPVIV